MSGLERLLCDWAGQLGSCAFFFFFSCPTDPPAQFWDRGGPFFLVCLLFFFRPLDPSTQYWPWYG